MDVGQSVSMQKGEREGEGRRKEVWSDFEQIGAWSIGIHFLRKLYEFSDKNDRIIFNRRKVEQVVEASWKCEALRLKGQLGRVDLRFRDSLISLHVDN